MKLHNIQPTVIKNHNGGYWIGGARIYDDDMYLCTHWSGIQRLNRDDALADARAMVRDILAENGVRV